MSGSPDNPGALSGALTAALAAAEHTPRDAAAVALARVYAEAIDRGGPEAAEAFGPKYLAVLTALGMTPAGRGVKGGATGAQPAPSTTTDELRARRNRRERGDGSAAR